MIHRRLIILLLCLPLFTNAQQGITFKVEDLSEPESLLWLKSYEEVLQHLILSEYNLSKIEADKRGFDYNIIARSDIADSLVPFGYHSFFRGMFMAYADHRPFVLSPDMIWLLISQGFSHHINNNEEELRHYFVEFKSRHSLVVRRDDIRLNDPNSPWEDVFPEFTRQIGEHVGDDIVNTLTSDFSTTTATSKVASEITIMDAMSPYFEFIVVRLICGIPEITLEGTPADWQKVLDKANSLRKYELDWWIDELEPLLEEFVHAANGKVKERFWRNMFKYHSKKKYGPPDIDGWILKFFPYDKKGNRNMLDFISNSNDLPNEIVKVDLEFHTLKRNGELKTTPLELWAGFVGLKQNPESFALKPEIGWMIRKRDTLDQELTKELKDQERGNNGGIHIRVKTVPPEILRLKKINSLEIQFIDEITIPEEMGEIEIQIFRISGEITEDEIDRIKKLFPATQLIINGTLYN